LSNMSKTVNLEGIPVGKVGHGLMFATWKPTPEPDEQVFETIIAAIDKAGPDAKAFLNSAEFYGINPPTANLELLNRFFTKYPELADRTFLSVKGGIRVGEPVPDSSEANLRRSVDKINEVLGGKKRLDLFESARVDPNITIEEAITTLAKLKAEGRFDHIGLSECSAETLRRAHKVHPIAAAEIEISPWSYEEETKKVIATAAELGIAVVGYSPLGRGFLTGKVNLDTLEAGDWRRHMDRHKPENLTQNEKMVQAITNLAQKKGVTNAQLAIAWVGALGPHVIPLPGSSHVVRTKENLDSANVEFSAEELEEINKVFASIEVKGARYVEGASHLWG